MADLGKAAIGQINAAIGAFPSLNAKLNDFDTRIATGGTDLSVLINDTTAAADRVYSSNKTDSLLTGKANATHTHTGYAASDHTHTEYSATDHTHTEYAATDHTHTGYSATTHNHDTAYAALSHTHAMADLPIVVLTQAEYTALGTTPNNNNTLYLING